MTTVESIFVGCNRQLDILDYSYGTGQIAFGANSLVAIYKPFNNDSKGVLRTLKHHKKDVTSVKWLPNSSFLISTSEDASICIWKDEELVQVIQDDHKSSVTTIAVLNEKIFFTGDADGYIIVWGFQNDTFVKLHESVVKPGFLPLSIAFEEVAKDDYVLAVGGTNTFLYIYSFTLESDLTVDNFTQCAILQGHEDWIKAISFKKESDSNWLIASGSQDRHIRLWRLRINEAIDKSDEDSSKLLLLSNKQHKFNSGDTECAINFDAIIMGHDDWISTLIWHPTKLQLLSSSADTSVMIWEPDTVSGIWISTARLGEISIKGASTATGASGGFWSAAWIFTDEREYIFTNGKTGSLRLWTSQRETNQWEPLFTVTGSLKPVTDLSWSENGEYLLSTSLDQTTRLFANWKRQSSDETIDSWHEFARPQIHGYDMICLSTLSNTRFISGGDEKILRSFDLPKSVSKMLGRLCNISLESEEMPESASLPVLGLSNKAENDQEQIVNEEEAEDEENEEEGKNNSSDILSSLEQPPLEDVLQRHTLFPEIEKLYGHGYEITTVVTSNDKTLIATACRSNSVQHAVIRIFQASNWQQLDSPLKGHNLTITRLAFSGNDKYLLGVSRDRQFSLWLRDGIEFTLVKLMEKAHSRIIWDAVFVPLEFLGGEGFVTVSRDKFVKLWQIDNGTVTLKSSTRLSDPVTAVDCFKTVINGKIVIVVGTEEGNMSLYSVDEEGKFELLSSVEDADSPFGRINRLSFSTKLDEERITVASAGDDCSVRIYSFPKTNL